MLQQCENCGNNYDKCMTIVINGQPHVFDCFECAIHKVAPHCSHCDTVMIGHGVEAHEHYYCCAHCAKAHGHYVIDRPPQEKMDFGQENPR